MDYKKVKDEVVTWVRELGKRQVTVAKEKSFGIHEKDTDINWVTDMDIESEAFLKEHIWAEYPNHAVLGEEGGRWIQEGKKATEADRVDYEWVLDPIDGTTNFIHGFPFFCISVALKYKNKTVIGVVYQPMMDRLFWSIRGEGAYMDGLPIQVSATKSLGKAVIATGFPYNRREENVNLLPFNRIVNELAGIRRTGSAALDLCYVACGALDGYWEYDINEWDYCAGRLILEEAAGIFEVIEEENHHLYVSSNGHLQSLIKEKLI